MSARTYQRVLDRLIGFSPRWKEDCECTFVRLCTFNSRIL